MHPIPSWDLQWRRTTLLWPYSRSDGKPLPIAPELLARYDKHAGGNDSPQSQKPEDTYVLIENICTKASGGTHRDLCIFVGYPGAT